MKITHTGCNYYYYTNLCFNFRDKLAFIVLVILSVALDLTSA